MIKTIGSFVSTVLFVYVLGAVIVSQGNIASVVAMGFEIGPALRLDAAVHDVLNMWGIYLPLVALSLLLGLPVASAIAIKKPQLRLLGYVLAGFVALMAMPIIMKAVLGISGIAATRTLGGLLAQGFAGGAGGYLFYRLTSGVTNARD